ncbi:probable G-protein coupled receptor 139 [Haliotis cracherodii]|uniref:probable G-protein coupled receptor 139 n=1 Tax=Haliotis cracherodii TaxID=6455 RepID=UPI0039EB9626
MAGNSTQEMTTIMFDVDMTENGTNSTLNGTDGGIRPPMPSFDLETILNSYVEYRWSRYLGIYCYPILVVLGTIGNVLSFIVMTRKTMLRSSTCYYMAVLAVADTMVLYFGCLRKWFAYLTGWDALILSPAACKIFNFLTYWSFDFAAWILVAMTVERYIAIHFPFTVTKHATIPRAKVVSIFLGVIFVGINAHFFATVTISDRGYCSSQEEYIRFNDYVFPWIDAALYSFIPFIVLLVFNILIILDSRKAIKRQQTLQASSLNNTNTFTIRSNSRLTVMLLSVSLTFLVASAPKAALIIIKPYTFDFYDGPLVDFHLLSKYTLTASVMNFLTYGNHAINFLLYCINGQKFRSELKRLIYVCTHRKQRRRIASLQIEMGDGVRRNSTCTDLVMKSMPDFVTTIRDPQVSEP